MRFSSPSSAGHCPLLLLVATLGWASGCSNAPDSLNPDGTADSVSDTAADGLPSDSPGETTSGFSLVGRIVDEDGAPIPKAMLVLCGNLDGVELCNQQLSQQDGTFRYEGLSLGFDHLQVLPYPSFHETGKPYCGMVLPVALPVPDRNRTPAGPGVELDLEDLEIPLAESTAPLSVTAGGDAACSSLSVHVQPDSLSFPGLEDEALFGIAQVPAALVPFSHPGIIEAFSFHPFACGLTATATVRYTPQGTPPAGIVLLSNSMETGELVALDSHVENTEVVAQTAELTWIVVAAQEP